MSHSKLTQWALTQGRLQPAKLGHRQPLARAISHCFTAVAPPALEQLGRKMRDAEKFRAIKELNDSAHHGAHAFRLMILKARSTGKTTHWRTLLERLQNHGYRPESFATTAATIATYASHATIPTPQWAQAQFDRVARTFGVDPAGGNDHSAWSVLVAEGDGDARTWRSLHDSGPMRAYRDALMTGTGSNVQHYPQQDDQTRYHRKQVTPRLNPDRLWRDLPDRDCAGRMTITLPSRRQRLDW